MQLQITAMASSTISTEELEIKVPLVVAPSAAEVVVEDPSELDELSEVDGTART